MEEPKETREVQETPKKVRHHWLRPTWLRRTLKTLGWMVLVLVLLPVMLYIPPVQTFVKSVACSVVKDKTGMDITIDRFRLKFPLDVSLQGVSVVEATGDTMARAREALVDVRLLPLLKLDVQIKRLRLSDGYYRMVSADSSMIMQIRAGLLDVDSRSSANMSRNEILLNKALLENGDISLCMNVWKKKPTPPDTAASTPFLIKANELRLSNISFGMSMLPTIDTLRLESRDAGFYNVEINLRDNSIRAGNLELSKGAFRYLTPTPEYIRTHPAPVDTTPSGPPMRISAARISLKDFTGHYGVKGARPQPGFDANYIDLSDISLELKDFYNEASTVVLPIAAITARERSGLFLTEGSGVFRLDSLGMALENFRIATPYSRLQADAAIPFALMELRPEATVDAQADASVGQPDIRAFMPSLAPYLNKLGHRSPLTLKLQARGTLASVAISRLDAAMAGLFSVRAKGFADNALDIKRLRAAIELDGEVKQPSVIEKFTGPLGVNVPPLTLRGRATADRQDYGADFTLTTPHGSVLADGNVSLNSEVYRADIDVRDVNVAAFMPSLGVGPVSATLRAQGRGFNPTLPHADTDVELAASSIEYHGKTLHDISLHATLADSEYTLTGRSANPDADFSLDLAGHLAPDDYSADGYLRLNHIDLQALGLSQDLNSGNADIYITATASPERWLYDVDLRAENIDWNLPGNYIHLPAGLTASLRATENDVTAHVESNLTYLDFESAAGLQRVVDSFTAAAGEVSDQIGKRELVMDAIQQKLPPFCLDANASGRGLINQFLTASGMSVDTVYAHLANDSIINGRIGALAFNTGSLKLDTLSLDLHQRGSLLDYKTHLGNRPGTLDEFASVDLNGYLGSNRVSAYLRQRNLQGETGYRLGLTAALQDSIVSVHFTPLKSTIAYLPWTLNADNHIDYNLGDRSVDANLKAQSRESSILVMTEPHEGGGNDLHLNLENIHVQDFLQLSVFAPPITADLNSDIRVHYNGSELSGNGTIDVSRFVYDKTYVGDLGLTLDAGLNFAGDSEVKLGLKVDERADAMRLDATLGADGKGGLEPKGVALVLDSLPLKVANAFIGPQNARLSGALSGHMDMTGTFAAPVLNGSLAFDNVGVFIPMMGSTLKFDNEPVTVTDNVIHFDNFDITGANANPITLHGDVNASDFSDISFDLTMKGNNVQLVNNDKRARSDLYGKLFLNLDASARGPMKHFDIKAAVAILGTSDVYYNIPMDSGSIVEQTSTDGVVKFVSFNAPETVKADTVPQMMYMRINASLAINPGTQVTVYLSGNGTDRAQLSPSGNLTYFQNFMGDMRLNGQLTLGSGFVQYSIPVMGEKKFAFEPNSNVLWNGDIMNPILNISATDAMKASVVQGGNSHLVNFLVGVSATGSLSQPKVGFDLKTNDDMTIQNQLQSMSADQRQQAAINMLITGQYSSGDVKTAQGPLTGNVYSLLAGQLNSWAAKAIPGVDLSFGVDQYDKSVNGQTSTTTSYSYQVSKSLFNNRFKINVGGNYSTDASADENLADNLLSDISFEYMLKQTSSTSMYVKLFRHNGFESILEGEITEMGVGFVMKRRLNNLKSIFRFRRRRKPDVKADTLKISQPASLGAGSSDSTLSPRKGGEL